MRLRRPTSMRTSGFWLLVCGWAWVTAVTVATTSAGGQAVAPQPPPPATAAAANQAAPTQSAPAQPAPGQPAPLQPGYAGSDTCVICHEVGGLTGTKHGQALDRRTPAAQHGCESCHGPGQAHVDDDNKGNILRFTKATPAAEASGACLNCHNAGAHAGWEGSKHEARNLTCTTCHSVHNPVSAAKQLVKSTETQVCATCHRTQVAKTERAVA